MIAATPKHRPLERLEIRRVERPPGLARERVEPNAVHRRDNEAPAFDDDRRRGALRRDNFRARIIRLEAMRLVGHAENWFGRVGPIKPIGATCYRGGSRRPGVSLPLAIQGRHVGGANLQLLRFELPRKRNGPTRAKRLLWERKGCKKTEKTTRWVDMMTVEVPTMDYDDCKAFVAITR